MSTNLNILCLFPHQDDEIGIVPAIKKELASKNHVYCVFLTDGQKNKRNGVTRNNESKKVLQRIGIDATHIRFLGTEMNVPDGSLIEHIESLKNEIVRQFNSITFHRIYCPSFEGGHQDHDASTILALILSSVWNMTHDTWEFPLYNGFKVRAPFFRVLDLVENNCESNDLSFSFLEGLKHLALIFYYRSQWKTWLGLFPQTFIRILVYRTIRIQKIDPSHLKTRPHLGPLLYERMGRTTYEAFKQSSITLI